MTRKDISKKVDKTQRTNKDTIALNVEQFAGAHGGMPKMPHSEDKWGETPKDTRYLRKEGSQIYR